MGLRILLIDDDKDFIPTLAEYLATIGHTVRLIDQWVEVFPSLKEFAPELVLVDLNMPSIRGEDVAITLKRFAHVPVYLHSAAAPDEIEQARVRSQADGAIRKGRPRDLEAELARIEAARAAAPSPAA